MTPTQNSINIGATPSGSNVNTFPSRTCTLAGADPTQTDQTASRLIGTTYQNSSSTKSIIVIASVRCAITVAGGNAFVIGYSDINGTPVANVTGTVGIEVGLLGEDNTFQIMMLVAPSNYYKIVASTTDGTCTLGKWFEITF